MVQLILNQILPYIGGQANVAHSQVRGSDLYVTVKDCGLIDLDNLKILDGVMEAELLRTRLRVKFEDLQNEEEKRMATDNKQIAKDVLAAVGGKENVISVVHCMTRLRFTLKDSSIPNDDEVKKIKGVISVVVAGGQYQVVIGQNVPRVYEEVCNIGKFAVQDAIAENLDKPKEKLTPKTIGSNILSYLAGTMTPLLPAMMTAALFKMFQSLLGPELLGVVSAESNLYLLLGMLYNAFFYFLPVYAGYTAAKKLNANVALGIFMGAMLLVPEFVALSAEGASFSVFGIPAPANNYSQTLLPIILTVWVMSYVERFFKKIIPDVLSTLFVPFLTVAVMVPLAFCLLAPAGSVIGNYVGSALFAFSEFGGFFSVAVIAALWEFLVMTGMHSALTTFTMVAYMQSGVDYSVLPAAWIATWAAYGLALGAFFRLRNKDDKSMALGYFISGIVGGVTEPSLYGVGLRYKRPLITMAIGGAIGGLYAGIMHVGFYVFASTNFLSVLAFAGGENGNFVHGIIACLLAMVSSAVLTYLFGFSRKDIEG